MKSSTNTVSRYLDNVRAVRPSFFLALVASCALTACGGGGSSSSSPPTTESSPVGGSVPVLPAFPASPIVVVPTSQAPVSPVIVAPTVLKPALVVTLPAGTATSATLSDCPKITATTVTAPAVNGADMQLVSDVLQAVDPDHGFSVYARQPSDFAWWVRSAGSTVNLVSIGTAIHEVNHGIDDALKRLCNADGLARYFVDGKVYVTGLKYGNTVNYSVVSETYPAALKVTRSSRFDTYITGSAAFGNDFSILLDELTAYSGGANFEVSLLSNPKYSYLANQSDANTVVRSDLNAGGMVDFMLYTQAYLKSTRLKYPTAYAAIQGNSQTLAYIQFAWSRAEMILLAMYPYSVVAGKSQVVPANVLTAIYGAEFLAELDAIGIKHKTASDWSTTYLR